MIGDCDHYLSPYIFGVSQGMARLGHWHSQVSIRQPVDVIAKRIADLRPHVIWTHMLLWPPGGQGLAAQLVEMMTKASRDGAKVIIHDGDYKEPTRYPVDLRSWCSLALVNHGFDRSAWRVPTLRWPYFAFDQESILPSDPKWACGIFFAGSGGHGPVYGRRTEFIDKLRASGIAVRSPLPQDGNTLFRTATIAASADTVIGFGRPGVTGWVDTRVFQYPGAGAILLHDDVAGYLEPDVHFLPYQSENAPSVIEALRKLRAMSSAERTAMRLRAFRYVQEHHSATARVKAALSAIGFRQ